jgi:hypothetical protein
MGACTALPPPCCDRPARTRRVVHRVLGMSHVFVGSGSEQRAPWTAHEMDGKREEGLSEKRESFGPGPGVSLPVVCALWANGIVESPILRQTFRRSIRRGGFVPDSNTDRGRPSSPRRERDRERGCWRSAHGERW